MHKFFVIIVAIGKLKSPYKELAEDFLKRMPWLGVIEIKESNRQRETRDTIAVLQKLKGRKILFDVKGKLINDKFFANLRDAVLIIGGSDGFEEEIRNHVDEVVSISKLTFNHQLFRIIVLEQLYRAYADKKGLGYAKH